MTEEKIPTIEESLSRIAKELFSIRRAIEKNSSIVQICLAKMIELQTTKTQFDAWKEAEGLT